MTRTIAEGTHSIGDLARTTSVVIPSFNAAGTLDAALGSVAGQQVSPGEVVVVDDGSTDATSEVAQRWDRILPLQVVRLPQNVGLSQCRHEGISRTTGSLLALLDADDLWLPDHLATLLGGYRGPESVVAAQLLRWAPGSGPASGVEEEWAAVPPPEAQVREAYRANFCSAAILLSKDLYLRAGGFRSGLRRAEDWDLLLRLLRAGGRVTRPPFPTYIYRIAPGSLSAGQANAAADVEVMTLAVAEATSDEERSLAGAALRERRARLEVVEAYDDAREGMRGSARRRAMRALRHGDRRVVAQALFVLASPSRAARWRDVRNADQRRML